MIGEHGTPDHVRIGCCRGVIWRNVRGRDSATSKAKILIRTGCALYTYAGPQVSHS